MKEHDAKKQRDALLPTSQTAAILKQLTVHLFNHSSSLEAWYLTGSMERRSSSSYWADRNYSTGTGLAIMTPLRFQV